MGTHIAPLSQEMFHAVDVVVEPATGQRNRLTTFFRPLLAIPHLILVGGPVGAALFWSSQSEPGREADAGAGGGVLGIAAMLVTIIAWFAILFTRRHPQGLWDFAAYYLRWRARAVAFTALLRDEYPPFGDGPYPVTLQLPRPSDERDLFSVGLRLVYAIPHLVVVWGLGVAWAVTTVIAWAAILVTGRYPAGLYDFGVGVLRWNMRVDAYLLLLHDEYPPFSLH
jgi:hypothetical protein